MSEQQKLEVLELARLACKQGASFDVVYEANGDVRVSLYPHDPAEGVEGVAGPVGLDGQIPRGCQRISYAA